MVTDQDVLSDIQSLLAEPVDGGATFPSGMWEPSEMRSYLNEVQQDVIRSTGCVLTRVPLACAPHVNRHALPQDWIATQRLTWVRASDSRVYVLERSDIWELDAALPNWRNLSGTPAYFTDGDVPSATVQIAPAASVPGTLKLLYLALPAVTTGAGVPLTIPDDMAVGLVWGTLAHALTKEGRAKDPARAAFAQQRFEMIDEAVNLLLRGWEP